MPTPDGAVYHVASALAALAAAPEAPHDRLLASHARFLEQTRAASLEAAKVSAFHPARVAKRVVVGGLGVFSTLMTASFLQSVGDLYLKLRTGGISVPLLGTSIPLGEIVPRYDVLELLRKIPSISIEQAAYGSAGAAAILLSERFFRWTLVYRRERLLGAEGRELAAVIPTLRRAAARRRARRRSGYSAPHSWHRSRPTNH